MHVHRQGRVLQLGLRIPPPKKWGRAPPRICRERVTLSAVHLRPGWRRGKRSGALFEIEVTAALERSHTVVLSWGSSGARTWASIDSLLLIYFFSLCARCAKKTRALYFVESNQKLLNWLIPIARPSHLTFRAGILLIRTKFKWEISIRAYLWAGHLGRLATAINRFEFSSSSEASCAKENFSLNGNMPLFHYE